MDEREFGDGLEEVAVLALISLLVIVALCAGAFFIFF